MSLLLSRNIRSLAWIQVGMLVLLTISSSGCSMGRSRGTATVRTQRPQTAGEVRLADESHNQERLDSDRATEQNATVSYSSQKEPASGMDGWLKQLPSVPRIPLPRTDAEPAGIDRL